MNNLKLKYFFAIIFFSNTIFINLPLNSSPSKKNIENSSLSSKNIKKNKINKIELQENKYLLGIGDTYNLKIFGAEELNTEFKILSDGTATLPLIGVKNLEGFTINEAVEFIENSLSEELINPKVELNLLEARPLTISIIGEVNRPGVYKLSSNSNDLPSLISIIEKAGGLSKQADLSKINLKRKLSGRNQTYKKTNLNLRELILKGNLKQNPYLFDGDVIFIKKSKEPEKDLLAISSTSLAPEFIKVNFIGEIANPGSIDLRPNSTLIDGILSAGGPTDWRSNYGFVEILRINKNGTAFRKRYKINLSNNYSEESNPILNDGDSIWIRKNSFAKATDTLGNIADPLQDLLSIWTLFKLVN